MKKVSSRRKRAKSGEGQTANNKIKERGEKEWKKRWHESAKGRHLSLRPLGTYGIDKGMVRAEIVLRST